MAEDGAASGQEFAFRLHPVVVFPSRKPTTQNPDLIRALRNLLVRRWWPLRDGDLVLLAFVRCRDDGRAMRWMGMPARLDWTRSTGRGAGLGGGPSRDLRNTDRGTRIFL